MNAHDVDNAAMSIAGTARSMGVEVEGIPCVTLDPSILSSAVEGSTKKLLAAQSILLGACPGVERRYMAKKIAKKRAEALAGFERQKSYPVGEAVEVVQKLAYAKFDESVDIAVRLGVNPKHADQMVRGAVVLSRTGKSVRVAVFAKGDKEKEARDAGAILLEPMSWSCRLLDFDRVIATPDMMGQVGKLGRVLGPRGLMPNPKVGSVTMNVAPLP